MLEKNVDIYIFAIILQMLENSSRMSSLRPTDTVPRLSPVRISRVRASEAADTCG